MEIGEPRRVITIEPIEDPVPHREPDGPPAPVEPDLPERAPAEPEKVTP